MPGAHDHAEPRAVEDEVKHGKRDRGDASTTMR